MAREVWGSAKYKSLVYRGFKKKERRQPKCHLTDEWSRRCGMYTHTHTHTHTHSGLLLSHKNNEVMPFAATWMDLEIITLSEPDKDKHEMMLLMCGI